MRNLFVPGRSAVLAREAAIATSHPLSTAAGLEILAAGGNAVDAAIAAVSVQCVVDPHMTGVGGDCFVMYAPRGRDIIALNGSGRTPAAAALTDLQGAALIDRSSPHAVTVPGAISGWVQLHQDHGTLSLERLFKRAIAYAADGYPVTERVAIDWRDEIATLSADPGAAGIFLKKDHTTPAVGEIHRQPQLARVLAETAAKGARGFYEGWVAEKLVAFLRSIGGRHTLADFAEGANSATYEKPISLDYRRGYEIFECPPNGQGIVALLILSALKNFDLGPSVSQAQRIHLHAEATKIAYAFRDQHLCDEANFQQNIEVLLSDDYSRRLAAAIDPKQAARPYVASEIEHRDTVYLCVVDCEGNAVSFINSIFHSFGSGRVEPTTGIVLHSRGSSFSCTSGHPNAYGPSKRPMHTIIPGMLKRNNRVVMPFGVMGGHYQAAGHAAFLSGVIDQGFDVQAAIDQPRTFAYENLLEVEPTIGADVLQDLASRGHVISQRTVPIGGAQAIWADADLRCLSAGSDQRKDGCALGF